MKLIIGLFTDRVESAGDTINNQPPKSQQEVLDIIRDFNLDKDQIKIFREKTDFDNLPEKTPRSNI